MQIVTRYPDGVFAWVDLGTSDPEAAKSFYGSLFGWSFLDQPTDSGMIYSMAQIEGHNVAGLGPLDSEMQAQGIPPFWSSYVKHDDVDAVAARAAEAGGNVMMPPIDVMDAGRMTMIQDPTGATFGVWQPGTHIGAALVNIPNALVWNELMTGDAEGAKKFYSSVFGWTYRTDEGGYVIISQDERAQAGMMQIEESMGEMPPNWGPYFLVEDVEAIVDRVKELGGNVLMGPQDIAEVGRFCVIQDPQGAVISAITYKTEQ